MPATGAIPAQVGAWLVGLEGEISLLQDLEAVATEARLVSPKLEDQRFAQLLEQQTSLCRRLEERRVQRAQLLERSGHPSKDFLVVVLGATPKESHGEVVKLFGRYMRAAELAQRQVALNREFFALTLGAVEDVLSAVVNGPDGPATYDALGQRKGRAGPLSFSTLT
jgi:hypothetical protein